MSRALLDTSVFIAEEQDRPLGELPDEVSVSVVTLAELELGVLIAYDAKARSLRLATLKKAQKLSPLPIDEAVASAFSALVAELHQDGRKLNIQDAWIAATARVHKAAICTQDSDFDNLPGLDVIKV